MAEKTVDIQHYTDLDLYVAFLPFLKKYLKIKGKTFPKSMPLSNIVDLIRDEINSDYNLETGGWGSEHKTKVMVRDLAKKGLLRLPSQRPKIKFTKKYKKILERLFFSKINLPPHAKVIIKEDEPYNVEVNTVVDWASAIKDPRFDFDSYKTVSKNLPKFLSKVLNIENYMGNPIKGEINIDINTFFESVNSEDIIKEIKTIIRRYYGSDKVRSLRFRVSHTGKITVKIIFPNSVYGNQRREIKDKISNKLQESGLNMSFILLEW